MKNGVVLMYFDPGTGSLIVQLLVAGIASVGAFFAIFKDKLKSMVKNEKKEDNNEK